MNEHTHVVGTQYLYSIFTPLSPNSEENQQNFDQTLSNLKFTKACTYPNQHRHSKVGSGPQFTKEFTTYDQFNEYLQIAY